MSSLGSGLGRVIETGALFWIGRKRDRAASANADRARVADAMEPRAASPPYRALIAGAGARPNLTYGRASNAVISLHDFHMATRLVRHR